MSDPNIALPFAVAAGLPGTRAPSTDEEAAVTVDVVAVATNHRVQGLVWSALESGVMKASTEGRAAAREARLRALRLCLVAEEVALDALTALDAAGVEALALKGLALAHLDHPDPGERMFADADLLIRRGDHGRAFAALTAAGFVRQTPPVRTWWERRFGKGVVMVHPSGAELDLHLAIAGGYFGARLDHDALWARQSPPFDLGGRPTRGFDAEGRLLHACCHVALGGWSGLRAQRDVAQLVLVTGADWRAVVARAERAGAELVVAEAVRTTWAALHLDATHPVATWAQATTGDARQRSAIAAYGAADRTGWAEEGRSVVAALSPMDRVLFLAGLALPSRASRRDRGRSWWAHLRNGAGAWRGARSRGVT